MRALSSWPASLARSFAARPLSDHPGGLGVSLGRGGQRHADATAPSGESSTQPLGPLGDLLHDRQPDPGSRVVPRDLDAPGWGPLLVRPGEPAPGVLGRHHRRVLGDRGEPVLAPTQGCYKVQIVY